jgi:hypothetical protein
MKKAAFDVVCEHENVPRVFEKGLGMAMTSECVLVLRIKSQRVKEMQKDPIKIDELNGRIVQHFEGDTIRYLFHSTSLYSHFIFDKETRNKIQLVVDPDTRTITLYPSGNCTGRAIRDLITLLTKKIEAPIKAVETICISY